MEHFSTWVSNAAAKLPGYLRVDPLFFGIGMAVPFWLLDQQVPKSFTYAMPVIGFAIGYGVSLYLRGKFAGAKSEPVKALLQWDDQRKKEGIPAVPALEAAAADWGNIDRALSTSLWQNSDLAPRIRRAADTGMLSIALGYGGNEPEKEREADLSALAASLDRFGGQQESGGLSTEGTARITELISRVEASRLARFV